MNSENIRIRVATVHDAAALLAIYAPYVTDTAVTYECKVPTPEVFAQRIAKTIARFPYLVAEGSNGLIGYAYAGPFGERAAYNWSVETSVYIDRSHQKNGLGKRLYAALETICREQRLINMYARVAYPEKEDVYLTKNSALFHARMGFETVGAFRWCGCKFGNWYSMLVMEKSIGSHQQNPAPMIPFPELEQGLVERILAR